MRQPTRVAIEAAILRPMVRRATVLYDAECAFCRLTARALRRLDWMRRLELVPLQRFADDDPTAAPARADLHARLHVRDAGGRWSAGGDAALAVAGHLPLLMPVAMVGRLPGMRRLADRGYRLVAGNRVTLGRLLDRLPRTKKDGRPRRAARQLGRRER